MRRQKRGNHPRKIYHLKNVMSIPKLSLTYFLDKSMKVSGKILYAPQIQFHSKYFDDLGKNKEKCNLYITINYFNKRKQERSVAFL